MNNFAAKAKALPRHQQAPEQHVLSAARYKSSHYRSSRNWQSSISGSGPRVCVFVCYFPCYRSGRILELKIIKILFSYLVVCHPDNWVQHVKY